MVVVGSSYSSRESREMIPSVTARVGFLRWRAPGRCHPSPRLSSRAHLDLDDGAVDRVLVYSQSISSICSKEA